MDVRGRRSAFKYPLQDAGHFSSLIFSFSVCQPGNLVTRERPAGLNHSEIAFFNPKFQKQLMAAVAGTQCRVAWALLAELSLPQCQLPPQSGSPRKRPRGGRRFGCRGAHPSPQFSRKERTLAGQLLRELAPQMNPPLSLASHWPSLDHVTFLSPSPGPGKWISGWNQRGAARRRTGLWVQVAEDVGGRQRACNSCQDFRVAMRMRDNIQGCLLWCLVLFITCPITSDIRMMVIISRVW